MTRRTHAEEAKRGQVTCRIESLDTTTRRYRLFSTWPWYRRYRIFGIGIGPSLEIRRFFSTQIALAFHEKGFTIPKTISDCKK